MERTHTTAVLEELQSVRRNHVGTVHEGLYPMGGTPTEMVYELTTIPIPYPP